MCACVQREKAGQRNEGKIRDHEKQILCVYQMDIFINTLDLHAKYLTPWDFTNHGLNKKALCICIFKMESTEYH